jgi:hypothetical protein
MRSIKFLLAAGALLLPVMASGQSGMVGATANRDCTANASEPAELYAIKLVDAAAARTDMLFDLRAKGGVQSDSTALYDGNGGWSVGPAWRSGQLDNHVQFAILTFPPLGPGMPGRISIDTATLSDLDAGNVRMQEVGNSIPAGPAGLNSIGLTIPGTATQYSVRLATGPGTRQFPSGSTSNGINIAFAPLVDVNDTDVTGSFCTWGAKYADLGDLTDPAPGGPLRGVIIGYNVYRIPGTAAVVPTPLDFKNALTDANPASGWVGFMDVRTLHQGIADLNPAGPGTPSPIEVNSTADITGMQNPNGTPYDADEVMIFQDSSESTRSRPGGAVLQPDTAQPYWYAVQPVMTGKVSDFGPLVGFTGNAFFEGEHRCDMDGDGLFDSVNLDSTVCDPAAVEFISPQAEMVPAIDGLGLTNNSLPLLSAPMFYNANPAQLPATGGVSVVATVTGSEVSLKLSTGLEGRSIAGYNVYRQVGEQRVRVNAQPILAQGAESNVYSLLDTMSAARGPRATSVQYMVETVYSDGTASTFAGPFTVQLEAQQPTRRRR